MKIRTTTSQPDAAPAKTIFRFEAQLISGPVAPSFVDRNPEAPSRIIDIRGSQTLADLHRAIFKAFDREDEHLYEFQIGGKKPMDRKAARYGLEPDEDLSGWGASLGEEKIAAATDIASLNLKPGSVFFYWFDFGDDWWHEIRLIAVNPQAKGPERYPRIVERKGESPPQYADWEPEEDEPGFNAARRTENSAVEKQRLDLISSLIKDFCQARLTEGYAAVCEKLLESGRGSWLPLSRGRAQGWAAGLVHAAGAINYLHDPSTEPYMKLRDIAPHFGVSPATMENKSREIRNAVNAMPLDPRFCLPELLPDNPLVWLKMIDGIYVDLRTQPREVQEAALEAGVIPFIPEAQAAGGPAKAKEARPKEIKKATGKDDKPGPKRLFE